MSARQMKGVVKAMKAMTHVLQPEADRSLQSLEDD